MSSAAVDPLQGPALQPPPGVIPNFTNPYDLIVIDKVVMAICVIIPGIAILLRLYYKVFVLKDSGADDWTLVLGYAIHFAGSVIAAVLADHGFGRHQWDVQVFELQPLLYYSRVTTCLYCVYVVLIKASILLQILKIFCPSGRRNYIFWSCWSLIVFLTLFYTASLFITIFACTPVRKYWDLSIQGGQCLKTDPLVPLSAAINAASDAIIIVLPLKALWALRMPTKKKMQISVIFFIALFAFAASVVRLYYSVGLVTSPDRTWNLNVVGLWTLAEIFTIIICACMPSLAGLFKHCLRQVDPYRKSWSESTSSLRSKLRRASWSSGGVRTGSDSSTDRFKSYVSVSERRSSSATVPSIGRPEEPVGSLREMVGQGNRPVSRMIEHV